MRLIIHDGKIAKEIHPTWKSSDLWRCGEVVSTTALFHSNNPELRFCVGPNPANGVLEIRDGEDFWLWSRLKIRPHAFCWSPIPQQQFIIIIINISATFLFPFTLLFAHVDTLLCLPALIFGVAKSPSLKSVTHIRHRWNVAQLYLT